MPEKKIKTAADMLPKQKARISKLSGNMRLRRKLMDMGMLPGVLIEIVRNAPLGDPMDIKIKGYHISLRRSEAAHISVEDLA